MAYNFISPGAAASSAIEEMLLQRDAQRRQALLDQLNAQNVESQMQDRAMNRQIQQASLDSLAAQRTSMEDERKSGIAARTAGMLMPGQDLDPATATTLREGGMGALVRPGEIGGVLPPEMGEGPTIEPGGPDQFTGTPTQLKTREDRQRAEDYLASLDPQSKEAQALRYEIATGKAAPAGMFDKPAQSSDITEYEYYVNQAKAAGQAPISFLEWQKQQANLKATGAGKSDSPYFVPVVTGNGVIPFNARTGQFDESGRHDLRPSATAEGDLTKAGSVLYTIGEIGKVYSPDRIGPLRGRYNNMQLAVVGEQGDAGLADLQTTLSTLKNTVINLRTGAQMSEPEAERILKEVPDLSLPPDVFMARMRQAESYFRDWYARRAKFAYGRNTPGDVDTMLQGDLTPAPSHTPGGPAAAPATPTRRKFNPATGRLE